jgi:flagellar biosynthesis protein FliR
VPVIDPNDLLAQFGEQHVATFFLVLGRISPLFLLAPLFSSKMFPARGKSVAAVAIAVGLSPVVARGVEVPLDPFLLGGLMLKELLVGLAYAFTLGALFASITAAGSLLDTLIGFSYGSLVDPVTGNQSSVLAQMYSLVGVLVFIAIGGDGWVLQGLARTYDLVPLLDSPQLGSLVQGAQTAFAGIFGSALQICAPILIALVITDAAFGVVSRVVPQLNVFAVGFPAKVTVGLLLIGVSLPFAADWLATELQRSVGAALQSLQVA